MAAGTVTPNAILDGAPGIGQDSFEFRYYVVRRSDFGQVTTIHPRNVPSITVDTSASASRSISNLEVVQQELDGIDLFTTALAPTMVLEDGTEWPVGVFYWANRILHRSTWQGWYDVSLVDGSGLLAQKFKQTFGLPTGTDAADALNTLLDQIAFPAMFRDIPNNGGFVGGSIAVWKAGSPRQAAADTLSGFLGCLPVHFDNRGVLRCKAVPDLQYALAEEVYTFHGPRVIADSWTEADGLIGRPNDIVAVNNGGTNAPIWGEAFVDPALPWSRETIGYEVTETIEVQGASSSAACDQIAQQYAGRSALAFKVIEFDTLIDPRHDMYMVVNGDGTNYQEIGFDFACEPGGAMHHKLVGTGFQAASSGDA